MIQDSSKYSVPIAPSTHEFGRQQPFSKAMTNASKSAPVMNPSPSKSALVSPDSKAFTNRSKSLPVTKPSSSKPAAQLVETNSSAPISPVGAPPHGPAANRQSLEPGSSSR